LKLAPNRQSEILNSFCAGTASKETKENELRFDVEDGMAKVGKDQDFDSFFSKVGPDATSTFDNSAGDSTEFANSEATSAATAVSGEDATLEEEDDDAAELEEDDEDNEEEDVENDAGLG
jgi:hypothetical protein